MIVLLSGIVVAFLVSVRTDLSASKSYEGSTTARLLADSALNLVIAQIREASTQPGQAWISQPGLIRTFGSDGKAVKSYKLYSADTMVVDRSFDPEADAKNGKGDLPPALAATDPNYWGNQPALWTDLNAPVADLIRTDPLDPTKKKPLMNYPIFDGNHINSAGELSLNKDANADIEGFAVNDYANRGVSMPVKWLYMLKDGTLVPAKASGVNGDAEVIVPRGREKTAQGEPNSIVARVAFWTDDETAKVNINTASEGTFWDTPVSNGQPGILGATVAYKSVNDPMFEWDLADRMGAQREYQRYPGHPATTCLSAIFGRQLLATVGGDRVRMIEEICKFVPRVSGAEYDPADLTYSRPLQNWSSRGGTVRAGLDPSGTSRGDDSELKVSVDGDRLYASIDEFLYSPKFGPARNRWKLAPDKPGRDTTAEMLEMARFFLTANSKAPEQNLFNLPRISIWPEMVEVEGQPTRRTAFDKLIAFCSTVGPKGGTDPNRPTLPFYFTRKNGDSATADLSSRNLELIDYLKRLTDRPFPGWDTTGAAAVTFSSKYGPDRNQILTEIFDYIRCTNLADRSGGSARFSYTQTEPVILPSFQGRYLGYFPGNPSLGQSSLGQVVPIEMPDGTRGIGRIATVSELALVMVRGGGLPLSEQEKNAKKTKVQLVLLPKLFCPMAGFCDLGNDIRLSFEDIEITVKDNKTGVTKKPFKEFNDPRYTRQPTMYDIGRVGHPIGFDSKFGGTIGWNRLCEMDNGFGEGETPFPAPLDSAAPNADMTVSGDDGNTLTFKGTVTLKISAPAQATPTNSTNEPIIQTIRFSFPEQEVPLPLDAGDRRFVKDGTGTGSNDKDTLTTANVNGTSRWYPGLGTRNLPGITTQDVVRSLAATGKPAGAPTSGLQGDMRLVAARKEVTADYFAPYNPNPNKNERNQGYHGLRHGLPVRGSEPGSAYGRLVQNMTGYRPGVLEPDIPAGIDGVRNSLGQPGDWDTGPAIVNDGPYCNKPDEGSTPRKAVQDGDGDDYEFTNPVPYLGDNYVFQDVYLESTTFFSPNRMVPSAVMFGSLPTGVIRNKPWQTLLFRPAKSYLPGGANHPGSAAWGPPDHLLLDLFWMPVVEPYAISEPFATSGKVNLNQQIAPFTNIKRDTGLRAVFKSVKVTAMNPDQKDVFGKPFIDSYKLLGDASASGIWGGPPAFGVICRRSIDMDHTMDLIADRLDRNKPFVSASEICDIPLIPNDVPMASGLPKPMQPHVRVGISANTPVAALDSKLAPFWDQHKLTGDNALEKPYAHLYPRLTTRSNSYTVHVRVQTLRKNSADSDKFIFKNGRDQVAGEFRGSFLLDRYLDPNLAGFVDASGNPTTESDPKASLGPYRFRVVSSKQFTP